MAKDVRSEVVPSVFAKSLAADLAGDLAVVQVDLQVSLEVLTALEAIAVLAALKLAAEGAFGNMLDLRLELRHLRRL
jgi:hypothetical protein